MDKNFKKGPSISYTCKGCTYLTGKHNHTWCDRTQIFILDVLRTPPQCFYLKKQIRLDKLIKIKG